MIFFSLIRLNFSFIGRTWAIAWEAGFELYQNDQVHYWCADELQNFTLFFRKQWKTEWHKFTLKKSL